MPNIIRIDAEHVYELPKAPKSKVDVLFADEKKSNQYWRRQTDFPQIWYDYLPGVTKENRQATLYNNDGVLISLSAADTDLLNTLLDRELYRRKYGVWFMNNGELTYITGNHYFVLQWGEMHGYSNPETGLGFGEYREFQRDLAYFVDIVEKENDNKCLGGFIAKAKKTGVTQFLALSYLNESTTIKEKRFTMMSKSHPDAKGTNMMLFQHGLERMVMIMKPQVKNINTELVVFDQPKITISRSATSLKNQLMRSLGGGFKTSVEALPTKAGANDGPKVWREWFDEFPKCKNPYPQDIFDKDTEGVKLGQDIIIGKVFISSYPPETDTLGFYQAKKIYYESSMDTLDEVGRTKSRLIKHFVSALNATEGTFDKYGKADSAKAFYMSEMARKDAGTDRRKLQKIKRQYPRNEKECWESGGSGSTFDNIRLGAQDNMLDEEEKAGAILYTEGNLEWTRAVNMYLRPLVPAPVYFDEFSIEERANGKEGKFRFYERLYADEVNQCFNFDRDSDGFLMPDPNTIIGMAVDPTDYKDGKVVEEGSLNGICAGNLHSTSRNTRAGRVASNLLIFDYLFRADDPDEIFEDVCKAIVYLGCYVIIEANKGWLVTMLIKAGFQNFILFKDAKTGVIRKYKKGDELHLINTTGNLIDDYCRAIARHIRKALEGEIDYLHHLKSRRGIEQLMNFDPGETKKFDWVVSYGLMRVVLECIVYIKEQEEKEREKYRPELMRGIVEGILDL